MPLTPRQLEVLDFIVEFVRDHRYAPTLREMADEFDLSRVTVLQHVKALDEKGYLDRQPNRARGITVTEQVEVPDSLDETEGALLRDPSVADTYSSGEEDKETRSNGRTVMPIMGHLSGQSSVRKREKQAYLPVGKLVCSGDDAFLLEVRSNQLTRYAILEGDMLVVDGSDSGAAGDLVVGEHHDEFRLLKRNEDGEVSALEPPEEDVEETVTSEDQEIKVKGAVTGVVRSYND